MKVANERIPLSTFSEWMKAYQDIATFNVPLRSWTTFQCMAKARVILSPSSIDQLSTIVASLRSRDFPWRIIGRGSNVLFQDGVYPGVLIDLSKVCNQIETWNALSDVEYVFCGAGIGNGAFLQWLKEKSLRGFEFSYGIPGSIGGGIWMNAGTPLGTFSQILVGVEGLREDGRRVYLPVDEGDFAYREFLLRRLVVVTGGLFRFFHGDERSIQVAIDAAKERRKNQPLEYPNTGSVFKNPKGNYAGALIEKAGLKGLRHGMAQISEKHANFIVNLGSARTEDAVHLMESAEKAVMKMFGIQLEREVHVIEESENDN